MTGMRKLILIRIMLGFFLLFTMVNVIQWLNGDPGLLTVYDVLVDIGLFCWQLHQRIVLLAQQRQKPHPYQPDEPLSD